MGHPKEQPAPPEPEPPELPEHIVEAESAARAELVMYCHRHRKPEGEWVFEESRWRPSERERADGPAVGTHRHYANNWTHTRLLVSRAFKGLDVPPDIQKAVAERWPKIHERTMIEAVDSHLAGLARKEANKVKLEEEKARVAFMQSAAGKIEARERQLAGLEAKHAKQTAKLKALETRIKSVKRSIAALERSKAKGK